MLVCIEHLSLQGAEILCEGLTNEDLTSQRQKIDAVTNEMSAISDGRLARRMNADNDIILHAGAETHRTRVTLSSIVDRLDPS